ncbi:MAG: ThuA domain-containing protein [Acidobacteria bacterium]|nr:ThuA domain-containing protein [Acidobacteriota bacterium]
MARFLLVLLLAAAPGWAAMRALIIDGQNNHKAWPQTTPMLQKYLEQTGLFTVDVATTPPAGADMSSFRPDFSKYQLVVSNYNGDPWPEQTQQAFVRFVRGGGGFVSVHAADNAFPEWKAYNQMIAVGGWGGRTEASGPYLRLRDARWTHDPTPGKGGSHGDRHEFVIDVRVPDHPITQGLPAHWMHTQDELYDRLRGPAQNVTVLASAYSDPAKRGTGENEPMLLVIEYAKGRVFHTTLGHDETAMSGVGFITTFQRGAEWAATGKVTQKVPADFPGPDKVSVR